MAWIQKRGSRYHLNLEFRGQHFSRSLRTKDHKEAEACRKRAEANLNEVERGRLFIPSDADIMVFLLSDGEAQEKQQSYHKPLTLGELFRDYEKLPDGIKEANTRYTEGIHMKNLIRHLGADRLFPSLTCGDLQAYVDARSQEEGVRGRKISESTIRKELGTLSSIWNSWALPKELIDRPAPTKGLVYRKKRAKAPFQTWQQIERQIARGGDEQKLTELWESLFLTLQEIDELLEHVQANCHHRMIHAMFVFAAHTGARRSEMLRSQIEDFDFDTGMVTLREKKRDRSKDFTFRYVPMTPLLRQTMRAWFDVHPGGQLTICEKANVPIVPNMVHHYFRWTVADSKWEKMRGWHVLRHSFCSNCALKGLDQRIIDSWMGHQTEDMRRRYRHLFPDHQQNAMKIVFGN